MPATLVMPLIAQVAEVSFKRVSEEGEPRTAKSVFSERSLKVVCFLHSS